MLNSISLFVLRLVSPLFLCTESIFDKTFKSKLGWDNSVDGILVNRWVEWTYCLSFIVLLPVLRCIKQIDNQQLTDLHVLFDTTLLCLGDIGKRSLMFIVTVELYALPYWHCIPLNEVTWVKKSSFFLITYILVKASYLLAPIFSVKSLETWRCSNRSFAFLVYCNYILAIRDFTSLFEPHFLFGLQASLSFVP